MDKNELQIFNKYPDILSAKQVQEALRIGRAGTFKLLAAGKITNFKIGNTYKVPKTALLDYIGRACKAGEGDDA